MSTHDDNTIEQAIQAKGLTSPRVTPERIEALMQRVTFITEQQPGGTTSTFVHAFLDGKFYLATGTSACVDPANFDPEIGHNIAASKAAFVARTKLWELEGYGLYMQLRDAEQADAPVQPYPMYRSSKLVRAFKLGGIDPHNGPDDIALMPSDPGLPIFSVTRTFIDKHQPHEGGYIVFYPDGYVSYSPAEPFEASCTRLGA